MVRHHAGRYSLQHAVFDYTTELLLVKLLVQQRSIATGILRGVLGVVESCRRGRCRR